VAEYVRPVQTVAVAPTQTTLATIDTANTALLTVQVTNTDATQTLDCSIQRQANAAQGYADVKEDGLLGIGPLEEAVVDVDCTGCVSVRVVGTASGAGLDAQVSANNIPKGWR
jgi:hypothetical protein